MMRRSSSHLRLRTRRRLPLPGSFRLQIRISQRCVGSLLPSAIVISVATGNLLVAQMHKGAARAHMLQAHATSSFGGAHTFYLGFGPWSALWLSSSSSGLLALP